MMHLDGLRPRHFECLVLVGRDHMAYTDVADQLGLVWYTVRQYVYEVDAVLKKMGYRTSLPPKARMQMFWEETRDLIEIAFEMMGFEPPPPKDGPKR